MNDVYAYLKGSIEDMNKFIKRGALPEDKEKIKKQTMEEHVEKCMKAFDRELKDTKIWKIYLNLFDKKKSVEKFFKFSICFHDIGKIFYQMNFGIDRKKGQKYMSFKGHEWFSVYLADKFLDIWLERDMENRIDEYKEFRWIVCSAILYHHHSMGLKNREKLDEILVCKSKEKFRGYLENIEKILENNLKSLADNDDIGNFVSYIENFGENSLTYKESKEVFVLDRNKISGILNYVEDLNRRIWELFAGEDEFRRKIILSSSLMLVVDYMGSRGRGEKTHFGRLVDEFIDTYKILSVNKNKYKVNSKTSNSP